jgi:hypothetical protein
MISKEEARRLEQEMIRDGRPSIGRAELARETKVDLPTRGICRFCGCKVAKSETICGECAADDHRVERDPD